MTNQDQLQPVGAFAAPGNWYRGALHVHTTESDGRQSPTEVLVRYRDAGYHFVCITDHGRVTTATGPDGLLVLPGIELGCGGGSPLKAWHFVGLGVAKPPSKNPETPRDIMKFLKGNARFVVAGHPYWSNLSGEDVAGLDGCDAVEVHNTVCGVEISRGGSEPAWDYALSTKTRLMGVAVDDTHQKSADLGKGWVCVRAPELSAEAIFAALKAGNFYASTGPEILNFSRTAGRFMVITAPCRTISFMANSCYGVSHHAEPGRSLTQAEYRLQGPETYLRVQCTDEAGRRAWTNPVYLT